MFAGAASFTDEADINADNREAVELLTALNIIQGYEDGSFDPDGVVTRAEMAKMIYTIRNGGNDDASAYETVTTSFTDISGHWAEGYIKYLQNTGIVAGKSATRFDPDSQVTTGEAMKMALVLAGYDAEHAGLTGTAWLNNTVARATTVGMTKDVKSSIAGGCTRQDAAQILSNTLTEVDAVLWSEFVSDFVFDGTGGMATGSRRDVGEKWMDLATAEAVLLTSVELENGRTTYTMSINGAADFTRVATDYSDLIGEYVNVLYKAGHRDQVYGVYVDEDCSVLATGVVGQLEADDSDTFKLAGTSYDTDGTVTATNVYTVNNDASFVSAHKLDDFFKTAAEDAEDSEKDDAFTIKLVDTNNDGDVNHAVIIPAYVAKVTYVNASGIRVDSQNVLTADASNNKYTVDTSYDYDDHNIADDIARDDWVVITDKDFTVDGKAVITKADVVSGTVGAVRYVSGSTGPVKEVRVDGTWYKTADIVPTADRLTSIGNDVDLVLYGGMYFSVDGSVASLDVAAVTGVGDWDNLNKALPVRLMFQDGTEEVVNVNKWDNDGPSGSPATTIASQSSATSVTSAIENTLVTFDIDDEKYTLTKVVDATDIADTKFDSSVVTSGTWDFDEDKAVVNANSGVYDIDDDAMVVILNSDGDYIYMTGAELKNRNDITFQAGSTYMDGYLVYNDDKEIVAMFGETADTISSGTKQYGYITELSVEYIDGERVLVIDVITADGKLTDVKTNKDNATGFAANQVISYTMDGDVMVITNEDDHFYYGSLYSNDTNRIRLNNGNRYTLTEDTVIIAIKDSGTSDAEFAGDTLSNAENAGHINAFFDVNTSDEVVAIFVEVEADQDFNNMQTSVKGDWTQSDADSYNASVTP